MDLDTLRSTIETHLVSNYNAYSIKFENVAFSTPSNTPWISCSIKRNMIPTPELAQINPEVAGLLIFQVFVPLYSGLKTSNTILNSLISLYNDKVISNIWFKDAEVVDVGSDGTWYQVNITFPFTYLGV